MKQEQRSPSLSVGPLRRRHPRRAASRHTQAAENTKPTVVAASTAKSSVLSGEDVADLATTWEADPRIPTLDSRRAWAAARGVDPAQVHAWFSHKKYHWYKAKGKIPPSGTYEMPVGALETVQDGRRSAAKTTRVKRERAASPILAEGRRVKRTKVDNEPMETRTRTSKKVAVKPEPHTSEKVPPAKPPPASVRHTRAHESRPHPACSACSSRLLPAIDCDVLPPSSPSEFRMETPELTRSSALPSSDFDLSSPLSDARFNPLVTSSPSSDSLGLGSACLAATHGSSLLENPVKRAYTQLPSPTDYHSQQEVTLKAAYTHTSEVPKSSSVVYVPPRLRRKHVLFEDCGNAIATTSVMSKAAPPLGSSSVNPKDSNNLALRSDATATPAASSCALANSHYVPIGATAVSAGLSCAASQAQVALFYSASRTSVSLLARTTDGHVTAAESRLQDGSAENASLPAAGRCKRSPIMIERLLSAVYQDPPNASSAPVPTIDSTHASMPMSHAVPSQVADDTRSRSVPLSVPARDFNTARVVPPLTSETLVPTTGPATEDGDVTEDSKPESSSTPLARSTTITSSPSALNCPHAKSPSNPLPAPFLPSASAFCCLTSETQNNPQLSSLSTLTDALSSLASSPTLQLAHSAVGNHLQASQEQPMADVPELPERLASLVAPISQLSPIPVRFQADTPAHARLLPDTLAMPKKDVRPSQTSPSSPKPSHSHLHPTVHPSPALSDISAVPEVDASEPAILLLSALSAREEQAPKSAPTSPSAPDDPPAPSARMRVQQRRKERVQVRALRAKPAVPLPHKGGEPVKANAPVNLEPFAAIVTPAVQMSVRVRAQQRRKRRARERRGEPEPQDVKPDVVNVTPSAAKDAAKVKVAETSSNKVPKGTGDLLDLVLSGKAVFTNGVIGHAVKREEVEDAGKQSFALRKEEEEEIDDKLLVGTCRYDVARTAGKIGNLAGPRNIVAKENFSQIGAAPSKVKSKTAKISPPGTTAKPKTAKAMEARPKKEQKIIHEDGGPVKLKTSDARMNKKSHSLARQLEGNIDLLDTTTLARMLTAPSNHPPRPLAYTMPAQVAFAALDWDNADDMELSAISWLAATEFAVCMGREFDANPNHALFAPPPPPPPISLEREALSHLHADPQMSAWLKEMLGVPDEVLPKWIEKSDRVSREVGLLLQ